MKSFTKTSQMVTEQPNLNADSVSPEFQPVILTTYCLPFLDLEWSDTFSAFFLYSTSTCFQDPNTIQNHGNDNLAALLKQDAIKQVASFLEAASETSVSVGRFITEPLVT